MRVISGTSKGRSLKGPRANDNSIRPALDKIKGAIFNILNASGDLSDATVLDLYAGTGSIGIEALSRGAKWAVFVDSSRKAHKLIRDNLKLCHLEKRATTLLLPLPYGLKALRAGSPFNHFDLIFIDPPYDQDLVNKTLETTVREKILAPGGTVIVEHSPRESMSSSIGLTLVDQRKYGQTFVSFLKG